MKSREKYIMPMNPNAHPGLCGVWMFDFLPQSIHISTAVAQEVKRVVQGQPDDQKFRRFDPRLLKVCIEVSSGKILNPEFDLIDINTLQDVLYLPLAQQSAGIFSYPPRDPQRISSITAEWTYTSEMYSIAPLE